MTILIEDSPRNCAAWAARAVKDDLVQGHTINPWATPWVKAPNRKRTAGATASLIGSAGGEIWFDPLTHALQMSNVGDYRYYDEYSLWPSVRGKLDTEGARRAHVRRVFSVQDELGARHLAPTILLHHSESSTSESALRLAESAVSEDPNCWLSIAGTAPFWSGSNDLDAHIGALSQLQPRGWFVTVVRPHWLLPAAASPEEIHGHCRTVRALSEYAPVHLSHGDLAGLPAVAAGASSLGTGWDQRQRVCSMAAFAERDEVDPDGGGGGWFKRVTFEGLAGLLKRGEAELLERRDPRLARTLGTLPPPGPQEAFQAHVRALIRLMNEIAGPDHATRYRRLNALYRAAAGHWPTVRDLTSSDLDASDWVTNFSAGLRLYGAEEGWETA